MLTIHYSLRSFAPTAQSAQRQVERLQRLATKLSFAYVGEVHRYNRRMKSPHLPKPVWFRELWQLAETRKFRQRVFPYKMFAFNLLPGQGCETTTIGLYQYPQAIRVDGVRKLTKLTGWRWYDFCKTAYANDPQLGGFDHFYRCHAGLIELLDYAREMGIRTKVHDEGGYFENRSADLLRKISGWEGTMLGPRTIDA